MSFCANVARNLDQTGRDILQMKRAQQRHEIAFNLCTLERLRDVKLRAQGRARSTLFDWLEKRGKFKNAGCMPRNA